MARTDRRAATSTTSSTTAATSSAASSTTTEEEALSVASDEVFAAEFPDDDPDLLYADNSIACSNMEVPANPAIHANNTYASSNDLFDFLVNEDLWVFE